MNLQILTKVAIFWCNQGQRKKDTECEQMKSCSNLFKHIVFSGIHKLIYA